MKKHLFLVGFMGAGKTSLGRVLADAFELQFNDFDVLIEAQQGLSIQEIFSTRGEKDFRTIEHEMLLSIHDFSTQCIFATGGGLPCFNDNMHLINQHGISIYLEASPIQLYYQLRNQTTVRPLLADLDKPGLLDFIERQLAIRSEYYAQAHYTYVLNPRKTWHQESRDMIMFIEDELGLLKR